MLNKNARILLKFIKIARKNMPNTLYKKFDAFNILPNYQDWNWNYEDSKCEWIIRYIEFPKGYPFKWIKKDFKKYINKMCYYDEFIDKAKQLIKEYKKLRGRRCYPKKKEYNK